MYLECCLDGPFPTYQDMDEFFDWKESLDYFLIHPFILQNEDHFRFVHDAYDLDGNVVGTLTSSIKMNKMDVARLITWEKEIEEKGLDDILKKNEGYIFRTLDEARPGNFPSREEIRETIHEAVLQFYDEPAGDDFLRKYENYGFWPKYIHDRIHGGGCGVIFWMYVKHKEGEALQEKWLRSSDEASSEVISLRSKF